MYLNLLLKNELKFMISLIMEKIDTNQVSKSDLCDYSDAYIAEGTITVTDPKDANYKKELAFKNNALFISCTSKINNTLTDNAEGLDIVMPMYI